VFEGGKAREAGRWWLQPEQGGVTVGGILTVRRADITGLRQRGIAVGLVGVAGQ
jgi:hypothetical protein